MDLSFLKPVIGEAAQSIRESGQWFVIIDQKWNEVVTLFVGRLKSKIS